MGGLSSKKAHRIECRDEFAQWTLDMVKEAYARARDLQKRRREAAGDVSVGSMSHGGAAAVGRITGALSVAGG